MSNSFRKQKQKSTVNRENELWNELLLSHVHCNVKFGPNNGQWGVLTNATQTLNEFVPMITHLTIGFSQNIYFQGSS